SDNDNGEGSGSVYVFTQDPAGFYVGQDGMYFFPNDEPVIYSYGEHHTVNGEETTAKLVASDGAEYDSFGHGVQMNDHGVVVVGASGDDDKGSESGSVYVYTPDGGS
uniref:FG-GAP repeat protein n=1 Tax=Pseudovibrio sp. POLY-S9 TaxID=1576596 RepID=UPI000AEE7475